MNKIIKGITYRFKRNIGLLDRTIRTAMGMFALLVAFYYYGVIDMVYLIALAGFALAQFLTVMSAKCIMCHFLGACTIGNEEVNSRRELVSKYMVPRTISRDKQGTEHVWTYSYTSENAQMLLDFIMAEQNCCNFFVFNLEFLKTEEVIRFKIGVISEDVELDDIIEQMLLWK